MLTTAHTTECDVFRTAVHNTNAPRAQAVLDSLQFGAALRMIATVLPDSATISFFKGSRSLRIGYAKLQCSILMLTEQGARALHAWQVCALLTSQIKNIQVVYTADSGEVLRVGGFFLYRHHGCVHLTLYVVDTKRTRCGMSPDVLKWLDA